MTTPRLTPEREQEIRARLAALEPLDPVPWSIDEDDSSEEYRVQGADTGRVCYALTPEAAALIANAPADLAALLAEVEALRAEVQEERARADFMAGDDVRLRRMADGTWLYEDEEGEPHYGGTWRAAVDAALAATEARP